MISLYRYIASELGSSLIGPRIFFSTVLFEASLRIVDKKVGRYGTSLLKKLLLIKIDFDLFLLQNHNLIQMETYCYLVLEQMTHNYLLRKS